jgi:signal transduction histidine kinase
LASGLPTLLVLSNFRQFTVEISTERAAMTSQRKRQVNSLVFPIGIAASIALVSLFHFRTVDAHPLLHEVSQRLYYLPVIVAAIRYGLKGGLTAGFLSVAFFMPHVDLHAHQPEVQHNQTAEMIMFVLIGGVAGALADARKREHRRYEQAVQQVLASDRLASLGQLSAALVHEVRNPLASIQGAAEALEPQISRGSRQRDFLDAITSEVNRLNKLINEFLNFARPRSPEMLPTQPNAVIRSVVSLVSKEAERQRLSITTSLEETIPQIMMDGEKVKQALLNLVINAMHATPPGGRIELSTSLTNAFVKLTVKDSGLGISDSVKDRLFTPFVTTKEGGTGLGLAIALRLIKQHDGTIEARNLPQSGAVFEIQLPLKPCALPKRAPAKAASEIAVGGLHG